jgi:D-Tyr-tRNAtyr deacylase
MNHVLIKLQDVQNRQRALTEKLAYSQIALFDQPDVSMETAVKSALGQLAVAIDFTRCRRVKSGSREV